MDEEIYSNVKYIPGKFPVVITAPHSYGVARRNMTGSIRAAEVQTDKIALDLAEKISTHAIVSEGVLNYDPNFDKLTGSKLSNPFKAKLYEVAKRNKVECMVDVHGLSDEHQYDFAIFYPIRFRKSRTMAFDCAQSILKGQLKDSIVQVLNFKEDERESLSQFFVKEIAKPAIQIEISRYIREDIDLRNAFIENVSRYLSKI